MEFAGAFSHKATPIPFYLEIRCKTPIPIQPMKEIGGITIAQLTGITQ